MNFFNAATISTLVRYLLQALGGMLVASGKFDAGQWETISGAVLVILPALFGTLAANADKVVHDGKTIAMKDLPPSTQETIKTSASVAPKGTLLGNLFGMFLKKQ